MPDGLGTAGAELWADVTGMRGPNGEPLVFSTAEIVTLRLACRQADDLAALEKRLAEDGLVTTGSKGQPKLSGLVIEARLSRAALAKLIGQLSLPEEGEGEGLSPAQRKAVRAAQHRWVREQKRRQQSREAADG
jgi:hypothetical protein